MAQIEERTLEMLELKNYIDLLMEEYHAVFYTQVSPDGNVRVIIGPCPCSGINPENFVTMFNTKDK